MLEQFFENTKNLSSVNKNTYQILCVPNITRQSNLNQDSYVLVMENVIKELNKIRDERENVKGYLSQLDNTDIDDNMPEENRRVVNKSINDDMNPFEFIL